MSIDHSSSAPLKGAEAKRSWGRVLPFAIVMVLLAFAGYGFGLGEEGSLLTEVSSAHTSPAAAESTLSPPSGLVSWWGGEGNANDSAGDNHGTLSGDTTFVPGVVGQAFSFDGNNDYIIVPHSNDLNPGTADFTVSLWVNTTADASQMRVIINKRPICTNAYMWGVKLWEGKTRGELDNNSASNGTAFRGTTLVNDGNWHHITLVRQNTSSNSRRDKRYKKSKTFTDGFVRFTQNC